MKKTMKSKSVMLDGAMLIKISPSISTITAGTTGAGEPGVGMLVLDGANL